MTSIQHGSTILSLGKKKGNKIDRNIKLQSSLCYIDRQQTYPKVTDLTQKSTTTVSKSQRSIGDRPAKEKALQSYHSYHTPELYQPLMNHLS